MKSKNPDIVCLRVLVCWIRSNPENAHVFIVLVLRSFLTIVWDRYRLHTILLELVCQKILRDVRRNLHGRVTVFSFGFGFS